MGDCVDREVALSRRDKEIETEAAWQAHFILWNKMKNIPDPCGPDPGYIRIAAIYIMYCLHGCNCRNMNGLRADTLQGYASAIGTLFTLRGFKPPIDISDPNNLGGIIITNCKREEDVAAQCSPLSNQIFAEVQRKATASHSHDSKRHCLFDVVCVGRFIGPRVSEYAQTSSLKVDYHVYTSGKKVIKAFTADDFAFYNNSGDLITPLGDESADIVKKVKITLRIQKNRQNGQAITLSADDDHSTICPVRAALRMVLRAQRLGQPDSLPVACHNYKKKRINLTGKRVAFLFREAAKMIHPNMSKEELLRFSAHSLRVWACVLLDEAGMSPDFIMSGLRWMGNSFRMYLRDTGMIQDKHRDILRAASQEVLDLIAGPTLTLISNLTGLSIVDVDETMGDYVDDMD
jgi:hypothetical protein